MIDQLCRRQQQPRAQRWSLQDEAHGDATRKVITLTGHRPELSGNGLTLDLQTRAQPAPHP